MTISFAKTKESKQCNICKGKYAYCFLHDTLTIEMEDAVRVQAPACIRR